MQQYFIVVDNPFNRRWYPEIIGTIYPENRIPAYVIVRKWGEW